MNTATPSNAVRQWFSRHRWPVRVLAALIGASGLAVVGSIGWVRWSSAGHDYSLHTVPPAPVGIVFGAEIHPDGQPSNYLAARLEVGRELLAAGKVRALLLTGDNGTPSHDEPTVMRRYLVRAGVPDRKLAVDDAGFDTYSSCARAYQIFGVTKAVVVTQDLSAPRTIALCRSVGIETDAVSDKTQPHDLTYWRIWLRDQLAATKTAYDMTFHPAPKFLGRPETTVRDAIASP